jgi:hypothetical protein
MRLSLHTIMQHSRRHWLFAAFFAIGMVLRTLATLSYRPAFLLQADAYHYLREASTLSFGVLRPPGYALFLVPFVHLGDVAVVPVLQHLMGLVMAIGIYALLRRLNVVPILAAVGASPVLLDGYQINIEHYILSETLFGLLALASVAVIVWRPHPSRSLVVFGGVLVAAAVLTRYVGLALAPALVVYLWLTHDDFGSRLRASAYLLCGLLLPLGVYWAVRDPASRVGFPLYGRVATFANCDQLDLPPGQKSLCPDVPARGDNEHFTVWLERSPVKRLAAPDEVVGNRLGDIARRALAAQPVDYASSVGRDLLRYFEATPPPGRDTKARLWLFPRTLDDTRPLHDRVEQYDASLPPPMAQEGFSIRRPIAEALRAYQRVVYTGGPLAAIAVTLGLAAPLLAWRWPAHRRQAAAGAMFALCVVGLLLFRLALGAFGYRYFIVTIPFIGAAGVAGIAWAPPFCQRTLSRSRGSLGLQSRPGQQFGSRLQERKEQSSASSSTTGVSQLNA